MTDAERDTCNSDANVMVQQTVVPTGIIHWSLGPNQRSQHIL
jgi:hypothetical protein